MNIQFEEYQAFDKWMLRAIYRGHGQTVTFSHKPQASLVAKFKKLMTQDFELWEKHNPI